MPHVLPSTPVTCHRCGHDYAQHRPACTDDCGCGGFRWVDPAPAVGLRGYGSDPSPVVWS